MIKLKLSNSKQIRLDTNDMDEYKSVCPKCNPEDYYSLSNSVYKLCGVPSDGLEYRYIDLGLNLICEHKVDFNYNMWRTAKYLPESIDLNRSLRTKYFLCLNRKVRLHRMYLLNELSRLNLINKGHISFQGVVGGKMLGGDDIKKIFDGEWDRSLDWVNRTFSFSEKYVEQFEYGFFEHLPYIIESEKLVVDYEEAYIVQHLQSPFKEIYSECYFEVVTETNLMNVPCQVTEKTFKSLCVLPVIIFGANKTLENLRRMGFETYPELFDESYDNEMDTYKRFKMIVSEIDRICKMDIKELHKIFLSVIPKIEHNRNVIIESYKNLPVEIEGLLKHFKDEEHELPWQWK